MSQRKHAKSKKAGKVAAVVIPVSAWPWQRAALAVLALAGVAVYWNSFAADFVFDGVRFIRDNAALRQLWPFVLERGKNRPVGFFTFAVNYALGGTNVWGYHAVNLAIHVLAAWLLFDLVRRTLSGRRLAERYAEHAWGLGLAAALVWLVHPLQTESVTYIYQRLESLMGMFYLATLWFFLRAVGSPWRSCWYAASVFCCALGMGTKEVMVACPLAVLWYDRVFVATSWREIVRLRGAYYFLLAGTWGVLAALVAGDWAKYESAGVFVRNFTALNYAWSQPGVILHYLQLCLWPHSLCLDYDWKIPLDVVRIAKSILALGALLAAVVWCMVRRPALGFLGGWFFLILAPTSSIAPVRDLAVEHRMYLPLAAPIVLAVIVGYEIWRKWAPSLLGKTAARSSAALLVPIAVLLLAVSAFGWRTLLRNEDYRSSLTIWRDTVRQRPQNLRARNNLSNALYFEAGDAEGALQLLDETIRLVPNYPLAYYNRGNIRRQEGKHELAIQDFSRAMELGPSIIEAYNGRGRSYQALGKFDLAIQDFTRAIQVQPNEPDLYKLRAETCLLRAQKTGQRDDETATSDATTACRLTGWKDAGCLDVLAAACAEQGNFPAAVEWQSKAVELSRDPEFRRTAEARLERYRAEKPNRPTLDE